MDGGGPRDSPHGHHHLTLFRKALMTTSSLIDLLDVLRKLEAEVLASMPTGLLVGGQWR